MNRMRLATTSGLAAAISNFRCRSMSAGIGDISIETADPENLGLAVGISVFISYITEVTTISGLANALLNFRPTT